MKHLQSIDITRVDDSEKLTIIMLLFHVFYSKNNIPFIPPILSLFDLSLDLLLGLSFRAIILCCQND